MESIFLSIRLNLGWPIFISTARIIARSGMQKRKTTARCGAIVNAITVDITIIMGERIRVRKSCKAVMRMVLTSVVALVIRLEVEKWSVFAKEKLWIFSRSEDRRFFAKPWLATAPNFAARRPHIIETIATHTIIRPTVITKRFLFAISSAEKKLLSINSSSR